jgi:TldD protein
MVRAEYAPAGKMPVVIANEFGGVIFHEACGHALEATSVAKGASLFANKLNQKVAADCVTSVDDGTIPNAWGSSNIDDEGTLTQRNVLIENGVLKSYLVDRFHAKKMNTKPNGCGRRESYKYIPTSRMSNTFIAAGKYLPEEIISATDYGLYAKRMGGGSVHPATGEFNFAVMEGYLIEKGRIVKPVRGATLIGKGIDVINNIDMVGNDLARGQGMCGSISGSVPADVGQPTIRVKELIVGGRKR